MDAPHSQLHQLLRLEHLKWSATSEEEEVDEIIREEISDRVEMIGEIPVVKMDFDSWVLAEGWPSWSFILESLGGNNISTCCSKLSLREREEVMMSGLKSPLVPQHRLKRLLEEKPARDRWMWIQGSRSFVLEAIKLAQFYHFTNYTCVIVEDKRVKGHLPPVNGVSWKQLSHGRLGGLTQGSFRVLSSTDPSSKLLYEPCPVRPTLKHILKSTEDGLPFTDNERVNLVNQEGYLTGNMRVKPRQKSVKVIAPNCFLRQDCRRNLSDTELMDVYDVDVSVQKKLCALAVQRNRSPSKTFVDQVPGKILYRLAIVVLGAGADDSASGPITSIPAAISGKDLNSYTQVKGSVNEKLNRKRSIEKAYCASILENGPEKLSTDVPSVDSSPSSVPDPNQKAAKNDDAKANEGEWNERLGRMLSEEYDPKKHDNLFEKFRNFNLNWYCRKVRRSFVAYLKATYGDDWYELANKGSSSRSSGKRKRNEMEEEDDKNGGQESNANQERSDLDDWKVEKEEGKAKLCPQDKLRKDLLKDLRVGRDAIRRACSASWWEWDGGSTLFFWRWPKEYRKDVRDGLEVCVEGQLPEFWARQRWPEDPLEREQLKKKLHKPIVKEYITRGFVISLTGFFAVAKGEGDIRIVYDATKSGLNESIWAPNFILPTIDSVMRNASFDTWYGDIDLGEMFLNYFLDEKLRPYAGVDATALRDDLRELYRNVSTDEEKRFILRWERNLMGLRSSPYNSIRTFLWGEDFVRGDRHDPNNPLRWSKVMCNLPGSENYDPTMPWVYKYDELGKKLAAFFECYVDDIRVGDSGGEEACYRTTHVIACRINYLGQQDSARKRRKVALKPGAWSGANVISKPGDGLFVTCSQEKWDKTKLIIFTLLKKLEKDPKVMLDRKELERQRGFLIHISRTFTQMIPYLKGIHHTLESWRFGRDKNGWKLGKEEIMDWLNDELFLADSEDVDASSVTKSNWESVFKTYREENQGKAPTTVEPVERLLADVKAISLMFESELPKHRLVRGCKVKRLNLMFGDASGAGFGATWETKNGSIRFRYGLWEEEMNVSSSNLRELANLVHTLKIMEGEGELEGMEIFVFTDNSTSERAYFKGTSKSERLHELILSLKLLETNGTCKIHFVHVAGTRMIAQGADGLSRGNLTEGVMGDKEMSDFVPLHLNALERSNKLEDWIRSWLDNSKIKSEVLTPNGWFDRGHDLNGGEKNCDGMWIPKYKDGVYIWAPPPAAAEAALEQLRKARHKRQNSTHVFVCPRLMTPYWAKHLNRSADLITVVPPGQEWWPENMYEPLIFGFYFPFLKYRPWQLKGQEALLGMEKHLRKVWKDDASAGGFILREFWRKQRKMGSLPQKLVRELLQRRSEFQLSYRKARK